ncbi:MAG TPA: hypothetical protein VMV46_17155 [Thermoanaerobaculia bacterium]|nr:hypothetical protein [Thermoanaerobaculia bacterium]
MSNEFLDERRKSLEELFFAKQDHELVARLRRQQQVEGDLLALRVASGIQDQPLLERLRELGLTAETVAALTLVPLVEVAWVDGYVAEREREAVLKAADHAGIEGGSDAYGLLERWLSERPAPEVLESWKSYIGALASELGDAALAVLESDVMERAWKVAEAAGGFLGAAAVSGPERDKLHELQRTFYHARS